jgi:hypothetical protein
MIYRVGQLFVRQARIGCVQHGADPGDSEEQLEMAVVFQASVLTRSPP